MTTGSAEDSGISPLERQQLKVTDPAAETFWHRVRFALVEREVSRRRATAVLDVGAGSGRLGDWMHHHHPSVRYTFRETSPTLADALRERFTAEADVPADQPVGADVVVAMLDVLEHIEDDRGALAELVGVMQHGCTLVITVPALQSLFSSWDVSLGHFRRYSKRSLRAVLEGAGLTVESTGYLFPELLPLVLLRKVQRSARADADFPTLPRWLNQSGYVVSSGSARLRRVWPTGTSVVAVARKSG